jgi:hypothetical protein
MQSLILAVQNSVDVTDLGAGTSAATFFRSLGGSFGVAILGAVLSTRLAAEIASRLPAGSRNVPPINEPSRILALPGPIRLAIQTGFVDALHIVFIVASAVGLVAVGLALALPDVVLRGAPPVPPELADRTDDEAAAEMEAKASSLI